MDGRSGYIQKRLEVLLSCFCQAYESIWNTVTSNFPTGRPRYTPIESAGHHYRRDLGSPYLSAQMALNRALYDAEVEPLFHASTSILAIPELTQAALRLLSRLDENHDDDIDLDAVADQIDVAIARFPKGFYSQVGSCVTCSRKKQYAKGECQPCYRYRRRNKKSRPSSLWEPRKRKRLEPIPT